MHGKGHVAHLLAKALASGRKGKITQSTKLIAPISL